MDDDDIVSLEGPLEMLGGALVLLIPLEVGGDILAPYAKGIGIVDGDVLRVTIPDWLAARFELQIGSLVVVDNRGGKFNISPSRGTE